MVLGIEKRNELLFAEIVMFLGKWNLLLKIHISPSVYWQLKRPFPGCWLGPHRPRRRGHFVSCVLWYKSHGEPVSCSYLVNFSRQILDDSKAAGHLREGICLMLPSFNTTSSVILARLQLVGVFDPHQGEAYNFPVSLWKKKTKNKNRERDQTAWGISTWPPSICGFSTSLLLFLLFLNASEVQVTCDLL